MTEDAARRCSPWRKPTTGPHKARAGQGRRTPRPPANDPGAADTPVTPENAAPAA